MPHLRARRERLWKRSPACLFFVVRGTGSAQASLDKRQADTLRSRHPANMAQVSPKSRPARSRRPRPSLVPARRRPKEAPALASLSQAALRCRAKFRRHFPKAFYDPLYQVWERGYKWGAHERWQRRARPREVPRRCWRPTSTARSPAGGGHRIAHQSAFFVRKDGAPRCRPFAGRGPRLRARSL